MIVKKEYITQYISHWVTSGLFVTPLVDSMACRDLIAGYRKPITEQMVLAVKPKITIRSNPNAPDMAMYSLGTLVWSFFFTCTGRGKGEGGGGRNEGGKRFIVICIIITKGEGKVTETKTWQKTMDERGGECCMAPKTGDG